MRRKNNTSYHKALLDFIKCRKIVYLTPGLVPIWKLAVEAASVTGVTLAVKTKFYQTNTH